jgi:predicted AlkP superfamily phosphohydrolase/phosphomutase
MNHGWMASRTSNAHRQPEKLAILALLGWLGYSYACGDGLPACGDRATATAEGVSYGYIGPGAGIALIGSFFAIFSAFVSALFFALTFPIRLVWRSLRSGKAFSRAKAKRVVVLGLDGLEPELAEAFLAEGLLPNLAKLKENGMYSRLGTACPPLSPVAWSSFTTGTNPGKHNIFDFISRNPRTYQPTQSSVLIRDGSRKLKLGKYTIPLSQPSITGLRKSKPFWEVLGEHGIFSAVLRVPITFPPDKFRGVQLSAMCVPDLRGSHGMFAYFTESGAEGSTTDGDVGGDVVRVTREGDVVRGLLRGPVNSLREGEQELTVELRVKRGKNGVHTMTVCGESVELREGVYTGWVRVKFKALGGLVRVHGLCRFLLHSFEPFEMYCTPIQIDPGKPVMPISHPRNYSAYLAKLNGDFATVGLAEDTWALSEERLDEDAFLEQAYSIHEEREKMFFDALQNVRRGMVACVFDAPDRIQHMFWRFLEDKHPALRGASRDSHKDVIRDMYKRMDDLVGRTLEHVDDDTVVFVMSDHGFKSFRRCVDLNAWLLEHGYLKLKEGAEVPTGSYLRDVDWSGTKAYALGLAGIFLNVQGREAEGIVAPADAGAVAEEISKKLTGLSDPENGATAVHEAFPKSKVYKGPYLGEAPDIIVGYSVGYRVSWDAVIGKCSPSIFSDNLKAWSGDHCIHPDLVPGVLFSNRKFPVNDPSIVDLAPTALELFGVTPPKYMDGRSLISVEEPCSEPVS